MLDNRQTYFRSSVCSTNGKLTIKKTLTFDFDSCSLLHLSSLSFLPFISLPLSLSFSPFISLTLLLSLSPSFALSLPLSLSPSLSISPSLFRPLSLSLYLSLPLSLSFARALPLSLSLSISLALSCIGEENKVASWRQWAAASSHLSPGIECKYNAVMALRLPNMYPPVDQLFSFHVISAERLLFLSSCVSSNLFKCARGSSASQRYSTSGLY